MREQNYRITMGWTFSEGSLWKTSEVESSYQHTHCSRSDCLNGKSSTYTLPILTPEKCTTSRSRICSFACWTFCTLGRKTDIDMDCATRYERRHIVTVRQIPEGMSLYARSRVSILLACLGNKQGVASPTVTSGCIELFTCIHTGLELTTRNVHCTVSFKEW